MDKFTAPGLLFVKGHSQTTVVINHTGEDWSEQDWSFPTFVNKKETINLLKKEKRVCKEN